MKRNILLVLAFIISMVFSVLGQNDEINTVIKKGKTKYSAYVSSVLCISQLTQNVHLNSGISGGLIINRNNFIGVYRSNYQTVFFRNLMDNTEKEPYIKEFSHRGFEYEYVFFPLKMLHFSAGLKAGTGKLVLNSHPDQYHSFNQSDYFISLTPQLYAGINITSWMKMKLGMSYRLIQGIESGIQPWGGGTAINYLSGDFTRPEFLFSLVIGGLNDKSFSKQ